MVPLSITAGPTGAAPVTPRMQTERDRRVQCRPMVGPGDAVSFRCLALFSGQAGQLVRDLIAEHQRGAAPSIKGLLLLKKPCKDFPQSLCSATLQKGRAVKRNHRCVGPFHMRPIVLQPPTAIDGSQDAGCATNKTTGRVQVAFRKHPYPGSHDANQDIKALAEPSAFSICHKGDLAQRSRSLARHQRSTRQTAA
jgi:hypothetical protein